MRMTKKVLSLILAMVMVLGLLPATALASDGNQVYISASHDGQFINDPSSNPMAYRAVDLDDLTSISLDTYGLSDYKYDKDGDGSYEITALHLYIYVHEVILGLDWNTVTVSGGAGSIYFAGGLFGFEDENLRYNYNGAYPADENGWGFTADRIVLSAGDYFDVAHFTDWNFYADSAYGFHYFTDGDGNITHSFAAESGTPLTANLVLVGGGMGGGDTTNPEAGYTVYYGSSIGNAAGSVTTDDNGCAQFTFDQAGTYYIWCDGGEGIDSAAGAIVSSPASASVTVTAAEEPEQPAPEEPDAPEQSGEAQDVSSVLNATMAKLAATVTAPAFGTDAGEWTVLSLARGGYYAKDNTYFTDYYARIVETVNETAASVNMNGALHKNKSTDNARLIVALSSIGKNATSVGDWDLVNAYSANGFSWIKKQGINGTIWALIALDSNNYETSDTTIRQQCVDSILSLQLEDGGWALSGTVSDPDITGMALTALYPYRDQSAVAAACAEAFACLSAMQHDNGTFASGGSECAESCAWVIVATTTWGINPDTDSRFIKNEKSVVDGLLAHYLADSAQFQHTIGAGANGMATDQSCYALAAYDRFINGETALFDFSDVAFDEAAPADPNAITATLSIPANIENKIGTTFNAIISVDKWNNEGGYKLVDFVMTIPEALTVTAVTAGERLEGGEVSFHVDSEGLLRCVYFDANENSDLTITGEEFPAEVFTVSFELKQSIAGDLPIAISGMSIKRSSDSTADDSMIKVEISTGDGSGGVVKPETGISFSAMELYTGDGVDLIPENKKAVAVAVTGVDKYSTLVYNDGSNTIQLYYSNEITTKTGVPTFVALVSTEIATTNFVNKDYYTINGTGVDVWSIAFGNVCSDDVINAQDALAVVDAWLRKGEEPTDDMILRMNVNGDSRINTFDALGIVEHFVNGSEFRVITNAAITASK